MTILAQPFVADWLARLARRMPQPPVPGPVSFAGLRVWTEWVTVPTRHGDIRARVYWPVGDGGRDGTVVPPAGGRPGVYVNLHGGGFVVRHPEQDDPLCRYLAAKAGVAVVNLDYDVAPRHRFPDQVEETYDALCWVASQSRRGWDGSRACVGGQSAGGSLAAGAARLALELGGPPLALQVLHYASLNLAVPSAAKSPASRSLIWGPLATIAETVYAPSPAAKRHRLASPAWGGNADGIEGIAPALVITCERDMLRAEGAAYAGRLAAAGALREHCDIPGAEHAYNVISRDRAVVERAYAMIARHVREAVSYDPIGRFSR